MTDVGHGSTPPTEREQESRANRALINDYRRLARDENRDEPKCPKCGHWMRWSERLGLWRCSWCKTKLSTADRSVVA